MQRSAATVLEDAERTAAALRTVRSSAGLPLAVAAGRCQLNRPGTAIYYTSGPDAAPGQARIRARNAATAASAMSLSSTRAAFWARTPRPFNARNRRTATDVDVPAAAAVISNGKAAAERAARIAARDTATGMHLTLVVYATSGHDPNVSGSAVVLGAATPRRTRQQVGPSPRVRGTAIVAVHEAAGHPCVCGEQATATAPGGALIGSSLSCYTVTFREVIEGVLAVVWGDSPDRETRFPRIERCRHRQP